MHFRDRKKTFSSQVADKTHIITQMNNTYNPLFYVDKKNATRNKVTDIIIFWMIQLLQNLFFSYYSYYGSKSLYLTLLKYEILIKINFCFWNWYTIFCDSKRREGGVNTVTGKI